MLFIRQYIDKPGSVWGNHLSSQIVAYMVKRISACGRAALNANLLAADRVYLHAMSPWNAVSSYLTRFTFSLQQVRGSFVSVALSLESPPVAVSDCHCSTLPGLSSYTPKEYKRLPNELPVASIAKLA